MTRSRRRRGALQTAELLIVLPVLGLIGMGLFQYGIFFVQQNRLQSAVDAACRVAAQEKDHYARQHKSEAMFYEVLGEVTWKQECQLDISLRDVSGSPAAMVEVKVPTRSVLPDLLAWVGLGIKKEDRMQARALMPCL
jgi:Flp pilus assembly protein TadG